MTRIICDFETASTVDLNQCGAAVYSEHPNTEILCLVWRREGGNDFGVWSPWLPEHADLSWLQALAENPENTFVSHAMFEQFIWRNVMVPLGMPELPPERWEDTQATGFWKSLPGKLEKLCQVLDLDVQKDREGSRLTIGLSKANKKTGMLDRSRATIERVIEYCKTDVAGEERVLNVIGDLSPGERKVWLLDQEINHRGVRLDMEFVRAAQQVVDKASVPLLEEFRDLTGGVNPTQVQKVIEWAGAQGVELENLQKGYLAELLGDDEGDDDAGYESLADAEGEAGGLPSSSAGLPDAVRRVLSIRQMLGSASIKKLARMRACVCADGRARGLLQYHGTHPGLWGGRLIQPQNFPKGGIVDADGNEVDHISAILSGNPDACQFYKKKMDGSVTPIGPIETVSMSLANAIVADPGKLLCVGDFSGVQARFVLGLAGQHDKTELIAAGADPYLDFACQMFRVPPGTYTKDDKGPRQKGKGGVLGCGFQCGYDTFNLKFLGGKRGDIRQVWEGRSMTTIIEPWATGDPETAILTVDTYRNSWAPKVAELWAAFKWAVTECISKGKTVGLFGCTFRIAGDFMAIDLPSGWSTIWFYRPAMRPRATDRGVQYAPSYKAMKMGKWTTIFLHGGIITENVVMACQRATLVSAMGRLTMAGMPLILNVHDEAIAEVPEHLADRDRFIGLMVERQRWIEAMGVPIDVDAWVGPRYRK